MFKLFRYYVILLALTLLIGQGRPVAAQENSLYDRLGGQPAIQAVVDEFLKNVAADARINSFFANTDLARLNKLLVEQICEASGGPCTYSGRTMREAHAGLGITDADFTALVEDLVKALDTFSVPEQEKTELLTALGAMQPDIVNVPAMQSEHAADMSAAGPSLYDRLGGQPAIQAVVDEFLKNVAADNRINKFFATTDLARLNKLLVEQICQGSGGPCTYTGRSMKETHMGLGISDADFNALVEDLVKALDTFKVPDQEKNDLLAILGPMQPDIVEMPAAPAALPATGGETQDASYTWWLAIGVGISLMMTGFFFWKRKTVK